ncbi:hypothetical protein [Actinomyces ruminicola]|uniref:hypothetical protein n=1 Tax=Actinomyces ruminicola TaxID=332524 RepID=UPI00164F424D|nr:hypothetical protein [Actinomyces ruminicola]
MNRFKTSRTTGADRTARRVGAVGAALVVALLGVAVLGGCAARQADDARPDPTARPCVFTYAVAQDEDRIYLDALWQGRLEVDEDSGCIQGADVGADDDQEPGTGPVGMVFPEGTEVTSDGTEIRLPSGGTIPIGPEVSLGGGFFPDAPATPSPSPGYGEYFMVNDAPE